MAAAPSTAPAPAAVVAAAPSTAPSTAPSAPPAIAAAAPSTALTQAPAAVEAAAPTAAPTQASAQQSATESARANNDAAKTKRGRKKNERTEWSAETKELPFVKSNDVTLDPSGLNADCNICGTRHKMRRKYDEYNLKVHVECETHLAKKAARENTLRRIEAGIEK